MLDQAIHWLTETILRLGYPGISILMFIESSFIPFPSELVMPPAGYLAAKGRMALGWAFAAGLGGSLLGALFNYWFAVTLGEPFLRKYGKYFFVKPANLDRSEAFFRRHGAISTFVGRLIPVIRQLISVPAGLARMPLRPFVLWTGLGAGVWCAILLYIGWLLGTHEAALREAAVKAYSTRAFLYLLPALILMVGGYAAWYRRRRAAAE